MANPTFTEDGTVNIDLLSGRIYSFAVGGSFGGGTLAGELLLDDNTPVPITSFLLIAPTENTFVASTRRLRLTLSGSTSPAITYAITQSSGQTAESIGAETPAGAAAQIIAAANKKKITHLAIFGDSRAGQTGASQTISSAGVLYWAQLASQSKLSMLENPNPSGTGIKSWSFSSGGQTFGSLNNNAGSFPRVAELISAASAVSGKVVAFLYCGANGMANPTTEYTNFVAVVTRLRAAGIEVVAFTEPYLGVSQTGTLNVTERNTYNASLIAYCTANLIPFVRGMELYTNGASQSFDYFFNNDGGFIHPNVRGAATIGIELARVLEEDFNLPKAPGDYRTFLGSPSKNIGWFAATWGNGSSTGFDTTPTNCTATESIVKRTDGQPGNWGKLLISGCNEGAAASGTGSGNVQIYQSLSGANLPPAGTYRAVMEIEIDTWSELPAAINQTNLRQLQCTVTVSGGASPSTTNFGNTTSTVLFQAHTVGQRQSPSPLRGVLSNSKRTVMVSQPVVISSDATSVILTVVASGNGELRFGNCGLILQ